MTKEPLAGFGRSIWVIGRSLCLFKVFFIPVDVEDKNEALSLQLEQWSPFTQTGQYVVWQGACALVWVWDEALRVLASAPLDAEQALVVPEDLFFPPPTQDGVRLVQCEYGLVAEYWRDLVLRDSRWWADHPDDDDMQQFFQTNDLAVPASLPEPVHLASAPKPWGVHSVLKGGQASRYELFVLPFFALIFLLLAFQGFSLIKWTGFEEQLQAQTEQLRFQVEPVLTARQQTYEEKARILDLLALSPYPPQLHLWAVLVRKLSPFKAKIQAWKYQGGKLELIVSGNNLDPGDLIRVLSEETMFADVSTVNSRKPGTLRLKMNVVSKAAQRSGRVE